MPDFEGAHGNWIWTQDWTEDDKRTARLVYFTKALIYDDDRHNTDDRYEIAITADCRYKLYVNGELVSYGPAKGDHKVHYLDTVDIGGYLRTGRNRLDVVALHFPEDPKVGNHSFWTERSAFTERIRGFLRCRSSRRRSVRMCGAEKKGRTPGTR